MSKFGIDISEHQTANFKIHEAVNEGVEFIILRAGYTGWGTGVSYKKDSCFESFYSRCKLFEIPCGAYWYSCANTYEKGVKEANFMYENCLKGKTFEYPIYIDVEDSHHQKPAGKQLVTEAIRGFCETLESKGYYVGIYANKDWFTNYIDTSKLNNFDKWIAAWTKTKPTYPEAGLWQFGGESNSLRSNKIAGQVIDQDYSYKDYPSIIKEAGLNGFNKSQEQQESSKNEPISPANNEEVYIVKKGDTLSSIAARYKTSYKKIAQDNKIANPDLIYPGQKIVIKNNQLSPANNEEVYIVKKGDTLSSIAARYKTSYKKIAQDNKIANPDLIYPGQKLVIK